jgi:Fuc2NAc and GlcNAc transferase
MSQNIVFTLIILFTSFLLTWVVKFLLIKKNIVDIPNERSSHTIPTPRGGGIAIVISWFAGLLYFFINDKIAANLFFALLSGLILVFIGILDDVFNLNPIIRIIAQLITAGLALFFLGGLNILELGFYNFNIEILLSLVAFIGIIWFINLYNFLDGIDGYAGMQAIFMSLAFFYFSNADYYLILAACAFGFIIWNWQPAKIFMGDVGSTLLGFNFAVFAIYEQNTETVPIIVFLIISSIFWFDATLTLVRRFFNKEKLTDAHKKHAYQRLTQSGYSHQKTVIYAIVLNILNFIIAYFAFRYKSYLLIFLFFNIAILYLIIRIIDKKKPFGK